MSRTWVLLPGEYADGARVVETTLRPIRPVCLIPEDDPGLAARFAGTRSLAWGGHVGYALPYSRSEGLREPWRRLLDLLDPDRVYALGLSREPAVSPGVVNMHAPREEPTKSLPDRLTDDLGRLVYTAEGPEQLFVSSSTLLHSALRAVGEDLKPPDGERFVLVPRLPQWSSAYLPVVARYGCVDDSSVNDALNRAYSYQYRFDLDLSESVRIEEVGAAEHLIEVLAGDVGGLLDGEAERAFTLPQLTLIGLGVKGQAAEGTRAASRRRSLLWEEGLFRPVVVTGEGGDVEDFALYWNLRSEHHFAEPFPIWMPLGLLEQAEARVAIEDALGRFRLAVGEARPRMEDLRIVSASTSATELRERLRERYPEAGIGADDLLGLFAATCEYDFATEGTPAHLDRGRTSVRPPRPEELKRGLIPRVDNVAYEVGVEGAWLPQSEAMAWHLGWMPSHSHDNVSKRGNPRFVRQFEKEFSGKDLLDVSTPDGWTLLRSVFEERGYEVVPTAKSRTALGQLALLGGVENLKVAASSKVHGLLKEMSLGSGGGRAFVSDRRTETIGRFDKEWGRSVGRDLLRWLIGRRLLFRGAVLKCPRCELSRWYEVDRIGETWRCDGCKEDMPIPLDLQSTSWRYRINELYAHGHDQGTLTPLLTLYAMHTAWGTSSIGGSLGFYPGVELKAKEGADVPFAHKEIDLVALRGSSLILAECKESVGSLHEPGEASLFAEQLGDLVVLADHLGASQLLVTSSTAFPEDKSTLLAETPTEHAVELVWLDGHDLLDPNYFVHPLSHQTAAGEGIGKPEEWENDYLDWARRSVADRPS